MAIQKIFFCRRRRQNAYCTTPYFLHNPQLVSRIKPETVQNALSAGSRQWTYYFNRYQPTLHFHPFAPSIAILGISPWLPCIQSTCCNKRNGIRKMWVCKNAKLSCARISQRVIFTLWKIIIHEHSNRLRTQYPLTLSNRIFNRIALKRGKG